MSNRRKSRRSPFSDAYRRARLVQNLLSVSCLQADCGAAIGKSCVQTGTEIYLIDQRRELYAHPGRVLMACATGRADAHQVVAQFEVLPDELASLADF